MTPEAAQTFTELCDDYRRVIERIVWLESMPLMVWGCLELQTLYRREIELRTLIRAQAHEDRTA